MNVSSVFVEEEEEEVQEAQQEQVLYVVDGRTLAVYGVAAGVIGGALVALALAVSVWHQWLGLWIRL